MKRKGTDRISSKKILEKAHKYISDRFEEENADFQGEDIKTGKPLRKATAADKERKREKARLKRQEKRELKRSQGMRNNGAKTEALAYLKTWKKDRSNWTFKKTKQIWLLRNIYNIDNISDKYFKILVKYLMGLQGAARERLVQEAQSKMNCAEESKTDENESKNTEAGSNEKMEKVLERARSILQMVV